ncbi:hypothetical protein ACFLVJ_03315, partial [Chloroflexota bacterium]
VVSFINGLRKRNVISQKASTESLRSIIERAVSDAEQIAASIKMKAQKEAEEEAVKIINQARQGVDEIRQTIEAVTQKETQDILSALAENSEPAETETGQKAQLNLLKTREEIEKEVQEEYKHAHSRLLNSLIGVSEETTPSVRESVPIQTEKGPDIASGEQEAKRAAKEEAKRQAEEAKQARMAQSQAEQEAESTTEGSVVEEKLEEAASPEEGLEEKAEEAIIIENEANVPEAPESMIEAPPEPTFTEKKPGKDKPVSAPLKLDNEALYTGEIELAITVPINPVAISKLYNYLQATPDMKILYTRGSWDRGTSITVSLDKPLPLIGIISRISGIKITPVLPQDDNLMKGTSNSLLGANRREISRIDLTLNET